MYPVDVGKRVTKLVFGRLTSNDTISVLYTVELDSYCSQSDILERLSWSLSTYELSRLSVSSMGLVGRT